MRKLILSSFFLVTSIFFIQGQVSAQDAQEDYVYKFELEDMEDAVELKYFMTLLDESPLILSSSYFKEDGVFKVKTAVEMDYSAFSELLVGTEHKIAGAVESSSGVKSFAIESEALIQID